MRSGIAIPLLAGLALSACDDAAVVPELTVEQCQAEVLSLRVWLNDLTGKSDETVVPVRKSIRLVTANIENAEKPEVAGPLVEIGEAGVRVENWEWLPGSMEPDALTARLRSLLQNSRMLSAYRQHKARSFGLLVAADREAPWSLLLAVHDAATRAGFERMAFLFKPYGAKQVKPVPSPIDAQLAELRRVEDPVEKLPRLAKLARRVCSACDPLDKVFKTLSVTNPQVRAAVLNRKLPAAVARCGCAVDLASLRALLAFMHERSPLIAAWFDISEKEQEREKVIHEDPDSPWKVAHLLIVSVTRPGDSPRIRLR